MALSKLGTTEMMRAGKVEQGLNNRGRSRLVKMELHSTLHRTVHQSDDGPIKRRIVDESGPYSRAGRRLIE